MKDLFQKLFPFLAVLVLVLFAGQLWKNYNRPYLKYQKEFRALLIQKSGGAPKPIAFQPGVRQRWIEKLNRADRCESCHLGVDDPRFENAPQPFKTHPDAERHAFEKYGCTVCHDGQGAATCREDAHGPVENWNNAITHEDFREHACSLCHGEYIQAPAPVFAKGRSLFIDDGCRGCHVVKGSQRIKSAPPLDGLAQRVAPDWLYRWLRDPRGYLPRTRMPSFLLSEQEAADMAGFLGQGPAAAGFASKGSPARGKTLMLDSRCVSCHSLEGKGGTIAPELSKIASKLYPQRIALILENPHTLWPESQMPIYGFSSEDIQDIVAYLASEYMDLDLDPKKADQQSQQVAQANKDQGRDLIEKYGCSGCHARMQGIQDRGETGVELTSIGSSHISRLEFGEVKVAAQDRTVPNWLYNKMKNPRIFKPGLKMPDFGFSDADAEAATTYLLSLTDEQVPASYWLPLGNPPSTYAPQGRFGAVLDKYRCLVCHQINGRGGEMATNLSQEGSRIEEEWLRHFMKAPDTIRPMLEQRMPPFIILDPEIKALFDYFQTTLVDDRVENTAAGAAKMALKDPQTILLGKELYYQKYACNACHQVNQKGGLIGPDLTRVGQRIRTEWIVYYLHDPKAFVNRSVEPVYKLTDQEIEALTAFLINPKEGS